MTSQNRTGNVNRTVLGMCLGKNLRCVESLWISLTAFIRIHRHSRCTTTSSQRELSCVTNACLMKTSSAVRSVFRRLCWVVYEGLREAACQVWVPLDQLFVPLQWVGYSCVWVAPYPACLGLGSRNATVPRCRRSQCSPCQLHSQEQWRQENGYGKALEVTSVLPSCNSYVWKMP